jgi:putative transposase
MAIPARNAGPENILSLSRVFFTTTKTSMGKRLFQSERNAMLLVDVLRSYVVARKFLLHDFVVMPDHLHLLLTVHGDMSIEKAMQLIKGGFSYRLKREFQFFGEVWQRGSSEVRADGQESSFALSGIYRTEPSDSGTGRISRAISLLLQLFGKEEDQQGLKPSDFRGVLRHDPPRRIVPF